MMFSKASLTFLVSFALLAWLAQGSGVIQQTQCSLLQAQVSLAYMDVLSSKKILEFDPKSVTDNENLKKEVFKLILDKNSPYDDQLIIDKEFFESFKELESKCPTLKTAEIATKISEYVLLVLPQEFEVENLKYNLKTGPDNGLRQYLIANTQSALGSPSW